MNGSVGALDDKGTGVIFLTVGAIVAILSQNDEPKNDSRTLIRFDSKRTSFAL